MNNAQDEDRRLRFGVGNNAGRSPYHNLVSVRHTAKVADGGEIILSGLLARDVRGVVSAYALHGFHLAGRMDLEGWATLLLQR